MTPEKHIARVEAGTQRHENTVPALVWPTKRQEQDLRKLWISLGNAGFEARWFITLTAAPKNNASTTEFLIEAERWMSKLKRQTGIKGQVKPCDQHIAAFVSVGIPELHKCGAMHLHSVVFSDQDLLRWRHLALTNKWPLGSINDFQKWDPGKAPNALDYLIHGRSHSHAILPHKMHCPKKTAECRKGQCKHQHLNLDKSWFHSRKEALSGITADRSALNGEDQTVTAHLYKRTPGSVRLQPTQRR